MQGSRKMGVATLNQAAAGFKVADLSLADWGRKEISIAEQEMPGLMAIRRKYAEREAARGRAHHRLAAHDHPDRGAHRDAGRAGRFRALGKLQHLLHPGPRRRRHRRHRRARLRVEGRVARRLLVVRLTRPSAIPAARALNWWSTMAATPRSSSTRATNWRKAATGSQTPSASHEEKVIKDLLKQIHREDPQRWHADRKGMARRV